MWNCLVVAYYFPPLGLSGVQRTLKFVKYLPQFGWRPTVLTTTPTGYYAHDASLLEELEGLDVRIERVGSPDPNRALKGKGTVRMPPEWVRRTLSFASDCVFIPDNKIGWRRKAVRRASELHAKEPFSVVFATAPPYTDLLIGLDMRELHDIPLVVDYRDPWRDSPHKHFPTPYHRWRNSALEKRVLKRASGIVVTNRRVKELMLKRYKFLEYNDVVIIPQGYDPADFGPGLPHAAPAGKLRITHAGVFYRDRSPRRFLQALAALRTSDPAVFASIEVHLIGVLQGEYSRLIRRMGLEGTVSVRGYLPHRECVRELAASDVLWLTLDNETQSPGKLYEYLGARKPILACVPPGFVRQTLEEAGGAMIVEPDDAAGIAAALRKLAAMRAAGTLPVPAGAEVAKYDRIALTDELSKMLGFLTRAQ